MRRDLDEVTIGIKSFYRPQKLEKCLNSIYDSDYSFKEVIVADDGEITEEKRKIYNKYQDIELLDLEYDKGLAASRNEIVKKLDTDYLLLMDDDMTLSDNVGLLVDIMDKKKSLGALSGILRENGSKRAAAHDIFVNNGILIRDIRERNSEDIELAKDSEKIYYFDFIPTCSLIRKECLEEGRWDPKYTIQKEHLDFFLNHKRNTDWRFAVSTSVIFNHYPGGSVDFKENRNSKEKAFRSKSYFLEKWNLEGIAWIDSFIHIDEETISRKLKTKIKKILPPDWVAKTQDKELLAR